ncbi:hypothetical protein ACET3Z_028175 [Daucus carota]
MSSVMSSTFPKPNQFLFMEPISPISAPVPISSPTFVYCSLAVDLKKRRHGEFENHRLELLIDHYYDYLEGNECGVVRDSGSRERCLRKLKRVLNVKCTDVDDNCSEIEADDDNISKKLNELAEICKSKNEAGIKLRYEELKQILGKDKCNKLKMLVRHEKFDYYSPLNESSRRVAPATYVEQSVFQSRKKFYWTDSKLRLLVTSYHSYLEKINNVSASVVVGKIA